MTEIERRLFEHVLVSGPCSPRELEVHFHELGFAREARIACTHLLDEGNLLLDDRLKLAVNKDMLGWWNLVDTQDEVH